MAQYVGLRLPVVEDTWGYRVTHPVETLVAKHRRLIGWLRPLSSVEPQRVLHLLGTLSLKTDGRARITAALERTDPRSWSVMEMETVLRQLLLDDDVHLPTPC